MNKGGWYQGEAVSVMQGGAIMQHPPSSFFLFVVSQPTFVSPGDKQVLRLENVHLLHHHSFVEHLHWGQSLRL